MIATGIDLTEKQVLFRIEGRLLESLDKKIARDGFTTRNAWFKRVVQDYASKKGAAAPARGAARKKAARSRSR